VKERNIQNLIRLKCSRGKTRLFVNDQVYVEGVGKFGLGNGSTDLVGVHTVTITGDMVGQEIGVAVFAEVKTPTGTVKPHQEEFMNQMKKMGCIVGVVRSVEDMQELLTPAPQGHLTE
jgi:hypothetical protein